MAWSNAGWQSDDSGWYKNKVASGGGALVLDGSNSAHVVSASSLGLTLTTTQGTGVIYVAANTNAVTTVTSVTGTGLTFAKRSSVTGTNGNIVELWAAPYSTNFSGTITVNWGSAGFVTIAAAGAGNASGTFDSGGPQTGTGVGGATITAAHQPDFVIFASTLGGAGTDTAGPTWTTVSGTNSLLLAYQITSATGSFTADDAGANLIAGTVIDAAQR